MYNGTFRIEYNTLKNIYKDYSHRLYSKNLSELDVNQLQNVIANVIKKEVIRPYFEKAQSYYSNKRIAVYFSMEFLIGRIVIDALINTGIKKMTAKIFADEGVDINTLEEVEDTALGNGGLGRLAACFVESAATTGYPVFGFGVYYKYGLFKQQFNGNEQFEVPDDWTKNGDPWFEPHINESVTVNFRNTKVRAVPYVLPIIGYNKDRLSFNQNVFPLTLWKSEPIEGESDENIVKISDYLYPNDSTDEGRKLRICQEYFFASATMQKLVKIHLAKHGTLDNFEDFYCFQMNDTHPVLACIEYIRLLEENGYSFAEASAKAKKCFAYTNHTVMTEALETWDIGLFRSVIPSECFKIIEDLNQELINTYIAMDTFKFGNGDVNWLKVNNYELAHQENRVHMGRIACYIGNRINGVAEIHSEILKESVLHGWYELYPEKFTNCTNGVTPRRWIRCCNPSLAKFLDAELGPGWTTNLEELERLNRFKNNPNILRRFADCKLEAKKALAEYILKHEGIGVDPDSIFDCQVKRIHEYKRQLMNAFRILYIYDGLKKGTIKSFYNTTFIIGGKAASSYQEARRIISLFKDIQELVDNDPDMLGKIKVVFVTNFNVSYGEKIYAAANFSEQISTAGTEASGTGNMKFMMNGSPTIGTMDGANVEIVKEAGIENNYIFGATVDELKWLHYNSQEFIESSAEMQTILPYLTDGSLKGNYHDIIDWMKYNDRYYVMYDLQSYICESLRAFSDYYLEKETGIYRFYTSKALENVIHSGKFSSDRTIAEYAKNIWHIEPVTD